MIRTIHLYDDINVGGVTQRMKNFFRPEFQDGMSHEVLTVSFGDLPPALSCDVAVIHFTVNWRKLAWLTALRARNPGLRIVVEEHSYSRAFEQHCVPNVGRFRTMLRLAYRLADTVVAVSEAQADWMREAHVAPKSKIVAIPACRPLDDFFALDRPRRDGKLRLGCIGRLSAEKGFADAIAAFAALYPGQATLTIAGAGPEDGALRRQAESVPGVRFVGLVTDAPAFYAGIDALVMPSRREAFGLTALEARAAGRPVVSYAVDGLVEQARCAGILVEPGDVHRLSLAMNMLANADLGALSHLARRAAQGRYPAHVAAWRGLLTGKEDLTSSRLARA